MALLTNNVREWEPRWRAMLPELDEIFEVVVDSAFVGMRKPEPEIYQLTLERLGGGVEPADCVFVDDIELNCDAARELGMTAVHVRDDRAGARRDRSGTGVAVRHGASWADRGGGPLTRQGRPGRCSPCLALAAPASAAPKTKTFRYGPVTVGPTR